ncbi:MAG TPA: helix-turn-helix transcriptional regulator [Clostridiales bacterium]|nr:helix-turn-helix transcriptional regulator [Clostridiales bacterium]
MATENIALTEAVYYILLSVCSPLHGYGIMQKVALLSGNRVRLAAGTLYGALNTMQEKKWIQPFSEEPNSRKKAYIITEAGKQVLRAELARLKELVTNGEALLEAKS